MLYPPRSNGNRDLLRYVLKLYSSTRSPTSLQRLGSVGSTCFVSCTGDPSEHQRELSICYARSPRLHASSILGSSRAISRRVHQRRGDNCRGLPRSDGSSKGASLSWLWHCGVSLILPPASASRRSCVSFTLYLRLQVEGTQAHPFSRSFFQGLCVLGYCVAPLNIAALVSTFVHPIYVRIPVSLAAWAWCVWGQYFCIGWTQTPDARHCSFSQLSRWDKNRTATHSACGIPPAVSQVTINDFYPCSPQSRLFYFILAWMIIIM